MTATANDQLARLLSGVQLLMLDFDGPICSVFAGLPAAEVAEQLRDTLRTLRIPLSSPVERNDDPLAVYRHSIGSGTAVVTAVNDALVAAEMNAISMAKPTPGAAEVIGAARESGRRVAVVSNNAAAAVVEYLRQHELLTHVDHVAARRVPDPTLMKPNPHYVAEAAAAIGVSISDCVLVGDSVTDIQAAKQAGANAIGFANKPGKAERLAAGGADVII